MGSDQASVETNQDHIYVGEIPGERCWSTDYDLIVEWCGDEDRVSIMHTRAHDYVLDMSDDPDVLENQECCMNQGYECGHWAFGPPIRLPDDCPECAGVSA